MGVTLHSCAYFNIQKYAANPHPPFCDNWAFKLCTLTFKDYTTVTTHRANKNWKKHEALDTWGRWHASVTSVTSVLLNQRKQGKKRYSIPTAPGGRNASQQLQCTEMYIISRYI